MGSEGLNRKGAVSGGSQVPPSHLQVPLSRREETFHKLRWQGKRLQGSRVKVETQLLQVWRQPTLGAAQSLA